MIADTDTALEWVVVEDSGVDTGPQTPVGRLTEADFEYQGAFRLPNAFNYGALGLDYHPAEDALYVAGPSLPAGSFGVVDVPAPVLNTPWRQLPMANMSRGISFYDDGLVGQTLDPDTTWGTGIEVVPARGSQTEDKLYGSTDWWYAVSGQTFPTVWFSDLDGSDTQGMFHVGPWQQPTHGNRMGDYLFKVPQWYANQHLGGRTLVTGKTRGAFGGSMGPTLFAFSPFDTDTPTDDIGDVVPLLYYPTDTACAAPNQGDPALCAFPGFTMCD